VPIRIALRDGTGHSAMLRSGNVSFTIPAQATPIELAVSYWKMGTIYLLEGFGHLLFLLTLLLIVAGFWPLLKTVTAFTLAHSLTLARATPYVIGGVAAYPTIERIVRSLGA
jgi:HupE / UreJ protein